MPPNGVEEWRARIGHWENRKLRWYQAHCGSRPRVPLHLHLERVISEARPMLCVLLLFSLVVTGVFEAGNGAFSSLHKLVGKARCCTCVRRSRRGRVWFTHATLLYSLCLALSLLLVLDGDVETNPGPISSEGKHFSYGRCQGCGGCHEVVSQARPNQPQRGSLSVSHLGKEGSGDAR